MINFIDKTHNSKLNGLKTYRNDMYNILMPYLESKIKEDNIIFTDKLLKKVDYYKYKNLQKIVRVLHNHSRQNISKNIIYSDVKHIFITHYDYFLDYMEDCNENMNIMFIPMSIDISNLPKPKENKQPKVLYYQNLRRSKQDTYNKLKQFIDFDILSYGSFNDDKKQRTHEQCLDIVNDYEIVITVGRGALEAVGMGCKVLNAGINYSGAIHNQEQFDKYHRCNFNTHYQNKLTKNQINDDISLLKDKNVIINTEKIDMNNYLDYYLQSCYL